MDQNSERLFMSAVTIAEVEEGIAKTERQGAGRKATLLAEWLETILHIYSDRIIAFDVQMARIAGRLSDLAHGRGHAPGFADLAIAATARRRGYVVLTRNMRHFTSIGVAAHDPFAALP